MKMSALVKFKFLTSTQNVITNVKVQIVSYFKDLSSRSKSFKKMWFSSPTFLFSF